MPNSENVNALISAGLLVRKHKLTVSQIAKVDSLTSTEISAIKSAKEKLKGALLSKAARESKRAHPNGVFF